MAKDATGQGKLLQKVVNITEIRPQDNKTGQQKLFGQVEEFAPGFNQWAGMMNQMLEQSQTENKQLRQDVKETTAQTKRLANSLEKVIPKLLDQSVNHTNPDLVIGCLEQEGDVAIADGTQVLGEALYVLTTGEISDRIGNKTMTATRMSLLLRDLQLYGNPKFHHAFKTGRKGLCQKYKTSTINEIYNRLQNPGQYSLDLALSKKYEDYIKPSEVQA